MSQLDLTGNPIGDSSPVVPTPGRLAVMAATGTDMRLLLMVLIMLQLPLSDVLSVAGC